LRLALIKYLKDVFTVSIRAEYWTDSMERPNVVVINDDPAFLDLIQDLVSDSRSYNVVTINMGMGAVERLRETSADAIVLDVRLEYDRLGYHVLEGIRRDPSLQGTPVIVCTADAEFLEHYKDQLQRLDADWLEKPFQIEDLLGKIDAALANTDGR
jgi:CheY-like chemotaxis protein